MKYAIIIPAGGADLPLDELGGRTPFENAATPHLDRLAAAGRLGTVATIPAALPPGPDAAALSLLGYDPRRFHTAHAPLEASALGIETGPRDWIFRLDLVTSDPDAVLLDPDAGAISAHESAALATDLFACWKRREPDLVRGLSMVPGADTHHYLIDASGRDYRRIATTSPHDSTGEPWADALPAPQSASNGAAEAGLLTRLIEISAEFLPAHEINLARAEAGLRPANLAWIWGGGTPPSLPTFRERFGLRGAMITSTDLLAGIGAHLGWERLRVPSTTTAGDPDYAAHGRAACLAIDRFDLVCCHVAAPAEAALRGDWRAKVASLEAIDRDLIGPVFQKLRTYGDPEADPGSQGWRLLVLPDAATLVSTRRHDPTPVPFAMAGSWVRSLVKRSFSEANAQQSDLHIAEGHELMEYFLRGGQATVRGRTAPGGSGARAETRRADNRG